MTIYNTDKPIFFKKDNLLGRSTFSRQLGKSLHDYEGDESLVIGIFGKWGTGKTSIINMVLEEIETESINDCNKPTIIRFTPWNYSSQDNLILQYFNCIASKLDINDNEEDVL